MTTAHFNRLLKQLSMGDMSALERLYNHYYATICSVAYCRLRKKEDAQDIASVVMIKLCSVSDKYIRNPNGFVYTLTVNCVKDFLKRKKPVVVEDFENTALVKENGNWLYVEQILASLSDVDREIVVQHVFGDLKFMEIAENLKLSLPTVKRRYKNCCRILKDIVEKDCG